jgi:2,3-bisphosphoglycerate-dependent phosphoglycerate mutase
MELVLVRHGLPVRIDGGQGPADPPLSNEGVQQAEALAEWWRPHAVDAIYSSPMRRARETAAPLAAALDLPVQVEAGLREFDADSRFYVPLEELRADEERWQQVIAEWTSPEAEAGRQEFRATVVATVEEIVARHPSQRVVVVCHGGVINAYLSHVVGITSTLFFEPAYTSVSRVLAGAGRRQMESANETPHLDRLDRVEPGQPLS